MRIKFSNGEYYRNFYEKLSPSDTTKRAFYQKIKSDTNATFLGWEVIDVE
jgi:hypothetical protein